MSSHTLTFPGILISVYGTVDSTSGGVISSYALDGAAAAEATSRAGPGDTYNQLFWTSPGLVSAGDQYAFMVWKDCSISDFSLANSSLKWSK